MEKVCHADLIVIEHSTVQGVEKGNSVGSRVRPHFRFGSEI
jgi:hypothetical protein